MGNLPTIDLTWRVSFWLNPEGDRLATTLPESLLLAIRRSRDYLIDNHTCTYTSKWSLTIDAENYVHFRIDVLSQDIQSLHATHGRIEENITPKLIAMIATTGRPL